MSLTMFFSVRLATRLTSPGMPAAPRAALPPLSPQDWFRWRVLLTPAAQSASRPHGPTPSGSSRQRGGSLRPPAGWLPPRPVSLRGSRLRNVADAALVMNTLQGYDARDPSSVPGQAEDFTTHLQRGIAGMRIGFTADFGGFPVEPAIRATIAEAVTVFEELGAVVEPIDLVLPAPHAELSRMWLRSLATMMLRDVEDHRVRGIDLGAEDGIPEQAWIWMDAASRMTMREVLDDRALRTDVLDALARAQERVDLIVGPTVVALPVENGSLGRTTGPASVDGTAVDPSSVGARPTSRTSPEPPAPACQQDSPETFRWASS